MWVPDVRLDANLIVGVAVAAAAISPAEAANRHAFGVCQTATQSGGAEIRPTYNGDDYLYEYHGSDPRYKNFSFRRDGAKVTLVIPPRHGKVATEQGPWTTSTDYHYWPDDGYIGRDRFVMQVEKEGVKVRIEYMIDGLLDEEPNIGRCDPPHWKISSNTPALDTAGLQTLRSAINIDPSIAVSATDLTGSSIGKTTATTITLDDNAAGHGWYIDPTPDANDEYLPTSNPNEWIAKLGSEAAGKMDMLSVLLHEYGHVLGIEHSADPHDYMGTTLAPGVRRLPSADELTLMAKLAGAARTALEATGDTPGDPGSPSPTLPLSTSLALVLAGRLRGTRYGTWNIDPSGVKLVPQYDIAANPQLANTGFTSSANDAGQADGWATTGDVRFANGAATLSENAAT